MPVARRIAGPQSATSRTVASTVLPTRRLLKAVSQRVSTVCDVGAATRAVTDTAQPALVVRVGIRAVEGASTQRARNVASLACTGTTCVAAVAVDTVAADALVTGGATGSIGTLRHAGVAHAEEAIATLGVRRAIGSAVVSAALVWAAVGDRIFEARTGSVAVAGRLHLEVSTGLIETDCGTVPVAASATTVAGTVVATCGDIGLGALVEWVLTVCDVGASSRPVANRADTALIIKVRCARVIRARPLRGAQSARLTSPSAPGVAAVTVNALTACTLWVAATGCAVALSRHASGTAAVAVCAAVVLIRTTVETVRGTALERAAILEAGIDTGA